MWYSNLIDPESGLVESADRHTLHIGSVIDSVRPARYCGKMYSRHFLSSPGLILRVESVKLMGVAAILGEQTCFRLFTARAIEKTATAEWLLGIGHAKAQICPKTFAHDCRLS